MRANQRPVYWQDLTRRRLSRRRLLAGAAALGVGAAGAALAACGGGKEGEAPRPQASPTLIAGPLEPARTRGSFLRTSGVEVLEMIRFVYLFNYAEGVAEQDGEAWYLTKHVPQVRELPGIVRFRSWKQWEAGIPYPSPGAPTPFDQFVRRTEVCFENDEEGIKAVMGNPQLWTPSGKGVPGFREFECMFLSEEPEFNLLQDAPNQQYKYMTLPLGWPKGRPQVDDNEPVFIDSYCILYAPGITFQDGEDWYLGHHTREGKQLPGMRHYKTWRTIPVTEQPDSPLKPNKWARLTELGMSPANYKATMVNEDTRIRFTLSPLSPVGVLGGWLNISIKLDQYDDFPARKE